MESNTTNNNLRKLLDTLVAGYLGRQKYWESLKCFMNESSVLCATQCGELSIILNDTIHGKHLEEILFNEYGSFGINPAFLDFGLRLRSLANEFTSLTNASSYWSDAQKMFYGRRSTPSFLIEDKLEFIHFRQTFSQHSLPASDNPLSNTERHHSLVPAFNVDSTTSVSSQQTTASTSSRRKCVQPVSINSRRREFVKEVVEPVVQTAQQIIDNGKGTKKEACSSLSGISLISIDENAVNTLDRCMAHENFSELIRSIEKDFPEGFFDYFPNHDSTENLHGASFQVESSPSNDTLKDFVENDSSRNLCNIPCSEIDESRPLCCSTPTKLMTQEKSAMLQIPEPSVVAESALFKERVEVECPYLPDEKNEDTQKNLILPPGNFDKTDNDSCNEEKVTEISAGWKKLAELCDKSSRKVAEPEGRETVQTCDQIQQSSENHSSNQLNKHDLSERNSLSNCGMKSQNCASVAGKEEKTSGASDISNKSIGKCIVEEKTVTNTNVALKSLIEKEIESLFENSESENDGESETQKGNEIRNVGVGRSSLAAESKKELVTEKNTVHSEENSITVHPERQVSTRVFADERRKKPQKSKLTNNGLSDDGKFSSSRKKQIEALQASSTFQDSDNSVASSGTSTSKNFEHKKLEKLKKMEDNKEESCTIAEKRKKEKEFLMKKEREEIERQKRELEEKELKRAAERERRRKEEEQREIREKEEREKRRKEREDREKVKKIKGEKLKSTSELKKLPERSRDRKLKKDLKSNLPVENNIDEPNEANILDMLFGDDDSSKPVAKNIDKEEVRRKVDESRSRPLSVQKPVGKFKLYNDIRGKKERIDRNVDLKSIKTTKNGSGTLRKDELDVIETKSYKKTVVSGVSKGREILLVGGGHSARVGMVLEKATRIRTKHEHEEKLKQEYRKSDVRRVTSSSVIIILLFFKTSDNTRKRILDLPIPKTPDLLSQILKPDIYSHNDSVRRTVSTKNITNCKESTAASSLDVPVSSKSSLIVSSSSSTSGELKTVHRNESSSSISSNVQVKKPRLDMAAIDAVLQTLHGLEKASSSTNLSFSTASTSGSEQKLN
ncbi:unnamed protein product [Thelazia callipaeda]|uniref:LisH domain-containing protein n=1 Tax=Thelazia callipaeda TaxID=103827 RepID=A0A158RC01_THECL|nr:unnamed protein product [Thelazia callipaeda]